MEEIRKELQKEIILNEHKTSDIFSADANVKEIELLERFASFLSIPNPTDDHKDKVKNDIIEELGKLPKLSISKTENQDIPQDKGFATKTRKELLDMFLGTLYKINPSDYPREKALEEINQLIHNHKKSVENKVIINPENIESIKNITNQYEREFYDTSEFINKFLKLIIEMYQQDGIKRILDIEKDSSSTYFGGNSIGVISKILETGLSWWSDPKKANKIFEEDFIRIPTGIKELWKKDIPDVYNTLLEKMEKEKYVNTKYIEFEKIFTDDKVIDSVCNIYFKPKNLSVEQIDYIHNKKDNSGKEKFIDSSLNRFFPIKFCLLLLAFEIYSKNASNDIVEKHVDYSDFSNKLSRISLEFSRVIEDYDKKNRNTRREDKKNTGFPSWETEKNSDISEQTQTSKRFTDTYLGKIEKNGEFTPGKLYDLGLIDFFYVDAEGKRTERSGKLVIQFSMEGQSLINLHKKISLISTEKEFFNDKEREFIMNHIRINFELEYKIINIIINKISKWDNSEMQLDNWDKIKEAREKERERNKDLENEIEKTINEWKSNDEKDLSEKKKIISDSKLRAIRISTIGRLVDLGKIVWTAEKNVNKYTIALKEFDIKI